MPPEDDTGAGEEPRDDAEEIPEEAEDGVEHDVAPTAPMANASGRQLVRNFAGGYLGLVFSLFLSVFLTPIALHKLGNSEYGLWIAISTFGSYVTLLGAGVSTAAVQRVATCIAVHDDERLIEVLSTARVFFWISGVAALAVTAAVAPFIGSIFHASGVTRHTEELALLLTGVLSGAGLMTSTPASAIYGSGRNSRLAVINTLLALSTQTVQIVVILLGGGLLGLFVVAAIGSIGTFFATDFVAKKSGLMHIQRGRATRSMARELLRTGRLNVLVSLSSTIAYQLDAVTIGVILPIRQVTPYDFALSTSGLTQSLATAGTSLLVPTYAHSSAVEDRGRQFRLYSRAVLTSMALSIPIVVSLGFFGQAVLSLWLHHVPEHTYEVMIILNCVIAMQLPGLQSFLLLIGIGRSDLVAKIAIPAAVLNLGFSIVATFWFGPAGPAIGSLPQVLVLELTLLPIVVCRILEVPYKAYLREAMAPLLVPIAMALATGLLLSVVVGRNSHVLAPFECVVVCFVGWGATGLALMRVDPALRAFVQRALRRNGPAEAGTAPEAPGATAPEAPAGSAPEAAAGTAPGADAGPDHRTAAEAPPIRSHPRSEYPQGPALSSAGAPETRPPDDAAGTGDPADGAPIGVKTLVLASLAVAEPMGQQIYEEEIATRAPALLSGSAAVRRVVVRTLRSPYPGTTRLPAHILSDGTTRQRRAAALVAYHGASLVHRLDLRLPPGPEGEILTVHDVVSWRFPDEAVPPAVAAAEARRAAVVICPSQFSADEVAMVLGVRNVVAIPNGVAPDVFGAVPLSDERLAALGVQRPFVLHAGGCTRRKNLGALAAAWPAVHRARPATTLALVGPEDPRRNELFEGVAGAVLLGRLPRADLLGLLASAAAVVVPSLYEGFGLPALEGMAAGTPVVAARTSSLPEVCGDAALLVETTNAALVDGLISALDGGSDIEELRRRGRERARRFTWEASAEAHAAIWRTYLI